MNIKKYLPLTGILIVVILLTGCSGANVGSGSKKYYTGTESIEMKFATESPPTYFNYDSSCDAIGGNCNNEIPIVVELKNKGSSDTYGALYISGYDPHMISIAGDKLPSASGTYISLNNGGFTFNYGGGGIYVGLSGGGYNRNSGSGSIGFIAGNGARYGLGVYTQNNQFKGMSITVNNPNRIGSNLGSYVLKNIYGNSAYMGYNTLFALEGDTPETPGGGFEVYEFPAYIYTPPSLEAYRQPIMITACFDYVTQATAMVCVDANPNSAIKKVCKPASVSLSGGQGGPVAVTRIDQNIGARKTQFTITMKVTKKDMYDELWDYQSLYKRDPNSRTGEIVKATDKNIVYIGGYNNIPGTISLSGQPVQCTPSSGRVRLDDSGTGIITCTAYLDGASESAYEAPLEIELWYGYSKSIQQIINIKKI